MQPTLRHRDGFGSTTPTLRPAVQRLQKALVKAGYEVGTDGLFGTSTRTAVRAFQRDHNLKDDGIVGPATWKALLPKLTPSQRRNFEHVPGFETFHGDLEWVHRREGHVGKPYWPGGRSGVTLDPGFDLGYQTLEVTHDYYDGIVSAAGFRTLGQVIGVTGNDARDTIKARADQLGAVRVTKRQASKVMPYVAVSYWKGITSRFPEVAADTTPPSVQTVMLSLAYNRGARNRDLGSLAEPLEDHDWLGVADVVGNMQQDHQLPGIRIRRRQEADLIRHEMDFGT